MALTQERLKQVVNYDPDTGVFTRKFRVANVPAGFEAKPNHSNGYVRLRVDNQLYFAHRLAWLYLYGEFPDGQIDHINGIRHDNSARNLRVAKSQREQQQNKGLRSDNKSGYPGVCFVSREQKWQARIHSDGRSYHVGYFDNPQDAFTAYQKAKERLHTFCPSVREIDEGRASA